jgi:hypothetical protein
MAAPPPRCSGRRRTRARPRPQRWHPAVGQPPRRKAPSRSIILAKPHVEQMPRGSHPATPIPSSTSAAASQAARRRQRRGGFVQGPEVERAPGVHQQAQALEGARLRLQPSLYCLLFREAGPVLLRHGVGPGRWRRSESRARPAIARSRAYCCQSSSMRAQMRLGGSPAVPGDQRCLTCRAAPGRSRWPGSHRARNERISVSLGRRRHVFVPDQKVVDLAGLARLAGLRAGAAPRPCCRNNGPW